MAIVGNGHISQGPAQPLPIFTILLLEQIILAPNYHGLDGHGLHPLGILMLLQPTRHNGLILFHLLLDSHFLPANNLNLFPHNLQPLFQVVESISALRQIEADDDFGFGEVLLAD